MPARAIWKAELAVGAFRVPVKLFAAVQDRKVHFRLLDRRTMTPVTQQMVDSSSRKPVPTSEIRKGIEVERGTYVLLSADELAALDPPESREIRIEQIIDRDEVNERWYDRPYYLGPDGDQERYFALADTLAGDDRIAIARWTMRKKRYAGALHNSDGYLMLETLRFADQIVTIGSIRPRADRAPDRRELALAEQLVSALEESFDPGAYRDEYRDQVLALVESKAKGKIIQFPKERVVKPSRSLAEDLEATLEQVRKGSNGKRARA